MTKKERLLTKGKRLLLRLQGGTAKDYINLRHTEHDNEPKNDNENITDVPSRIDKTL
jgi:hypothetical protein